MTTEKRVTYRKLGAVGPAVYPLALGCMGMSGQLSDSLEALDVKLSPADLLGIEEAVPASAAAGTRYDEHQMKMLDSEA